MPQARTAPARGFRVHARHTDPQSARYVVEPTFEAAAVAYVETFSPPVTDAPDISVIVHEVASGHEHCFRIDLETGDAAPCG